MAHHTSVTAKPWSESNNYKVMSSTMGTVQPPQYNAPPPPLPKQYSLSSPVCSSSMHYLHQTQQTIQPTTSSCSSSQNIPETHKSMWAINASENGGFLFVLFGTSITFFLFFKCSVLNETDSAYRTRSLPVWGKFKPRPVSTTDDLEELYAKVRRLYIFGMIIKKFFFL